MIILAWNCRGLGQPSAIRDLIALVRDSNPDVLILMETKIVEPVLVSRLRRIRFGKYLYVPPVGLSGGFCLAWRDYIDLEPVSISKNLISCLVFSNPVSSPWLLSAIYGPTRSVEKRDFWLNFHKEVDRFNGGWLVIGDFNGVFYRGDRHGGREETSSSSHMINAVDNLGLVELPSQGLKYTWSNGRGASQEIKAKLDRGIANADWWNLFPNADMKILPHISSDHSPVVLNSEGCSSFARRPFRFEAIWTRDRRSHWIVEHAWAKGFHPNPSTRFCRSLYHTRRSLSFWNKYQFGKAKVQWRLEGDRCSRFFFMTTMIRRKSNRIDCLKLDDGVWIHARNQIGNLFFARFESVFDSPTQPPLVDFSTLVDPIVTEEDNAELLRIPTGEEVRNVVFSMGAFKAPGPDGMTALFYKHYWDIVGWDLVAVVREFFLSNLMTQRLNESFIVLIPKKPNSTRMNHYRPISVCNVAYRVITKIIANRLKPLLNRLICPTQNAFVPGRSIHDNSILVQEAIHSMKKKKGSLGWMALKIDLEKAYNRVSWQFINEVLLAYGFDARWVGWVSKCISSATMKLLINGAYVRDIKPKRGLRQGDPLSPYLFILCTEILSRMFMSKVENDMIHGFKLARGGPPLHHLLFADDIFVFGKACFTEARHIKETLDSFCSWSGLSFNSSKSSIFFSGNTRGAVANQLTGFLGFEHISMDSCYLGLPMFRTNKRNDFNYLVECLDSKLAGWKSRLLSKASRLTLIKFVALAMPIYAMHTARIPKAICAKLDARIRRFWWGSKEENARPLCLKAWDDLCVPKAYGGLGLRRMSAMNEAVLAKWGWDLLTGKRSQCLLFLQGKYLRAGSFISVDAVSSDSVFWKAILQSRNTILRGACYQIGDGASINIWEDPWVPNCLEFRPRASPNHIREACMVKDLFSHSGHWDTHKVRSIFIPEDASRILSIQLPIRPSRDYWCWLPASSGKFSTRSFYLFVNNQRLVAASNIPKKVWLSIWNANILPRHKLLWWQILSNCLPTKTRINRCIPGIDILCPLCGFGSESLLHLLLYCDFVKVIWFSSPWNMRPDDLHVNDPADLLNVLLKMDEMLGCGNLLLFASIMFDLVWKCRNEVVHGGVNPGPVMLLRRILKSFNDTTCSLSRSTSVTASWCPPPLDWIKFSMDAAVGDSCSCAAMVVRDHTGSLLFWKSSKVFSVDPVVVEAQAMLLAISCAVSIFTGCCCWFESDAKTVVDSILIPTVPLYWPISAVSSNCRVLLDYISTWHMSHAIRSRNVYAHNVARWCLLNDVYDDYSHVLLPSYVLSDHFGPKTKKYYYYFPSFSFLLFFSLSSNFVVSSSLRFYLYRLMSAPSVGNKKNFFYSYF
ncbi:hypothetical protein UlMin_007353 [Ulmus minor]